MTLKTEEANGIVQATILFQEGSVTNADQFKEEILGIIGKGTKLIVLNFKNVSYVDSSFLGSLVVALKYAISKGADIYLVELKADVHSLLHLIRIDKVFKIFKDYNEAIASLK